VGGWPTRELLGVLEGPKGLHVVGAEVVEVAPIYDNPGGTSTLVAAEAVHSLIMLMVDTLVEDQHRSLRHANDA